MLNPLRAPLARALAPVGERLARTGLSPNVVTVVGTAGVVVGALVFYPRGHFLAGTLFITAFIFSDLLDGTLARARGGGSLWGAFLDSSLDRVGDAAIFCGLALWWAGDGDDLVLTSAALYCLVGGALVSYVKARAEGLGLRCDVGVAERSERLIIILIATGFTGLLGLPWIQITALWALVAAITVTIGQRLFVVYRQAARQPLAARPDPAPADAAAGRRRR